jgi:hypothetical protein
MHDALARQVFGQRSASRLAVLLSATGGAVIAQRRRRELGRRLVLCDPLLELDQLQLQLIDEPGAALRGGSELVAPQLGNAQGGLPRMRTQRLHRISIRWARGSRGETFRAGFVQNLAVELATDQNANLSTKFT